VLPYSTRYGFDGIDWDIEHRTGDMVACGKVINTVIADLKLRMPTMQMSIAPQVSIPLVLVCHPSPFLLHTHPLLHIRHVKGVRGGPEQSPPFVVLVVGWEQ
jgi:hypothetical protein